MNTTLLYLGRIILGGYFILNGINHFRMLEMMSGYAKSKGAPLPKLSVSFSGLLLLIGGVSILFNLFPVLGLASLIIFLVPVTLIMHAFWKTEDAQAKMGEMVNFMKNFALLGAVIMLLAHALA
jgi:putative oxidoreductase